MQRAGVLVFGSINVDVVARAARIPRPGETVLARSRDTFFGGKGANQAVAAARARRDPAMRVAMAGCVGRDAMGDDCTANLAANGVSIDLIRRVDVPTGCALIVVDDRAENAITVVPGANAQAAATQVDDAALAMFALLAMQMEVSADAVLALARRARAAGVRVLLNLAPAPEALAREAVEDLFGAIDVLVVNEHELALAASALAMADSDAASALARRFDLTVVLTRGARGVRAVTPGGTTHDLAGRPISAVDTTGAGDTFVGVLAAGLAQGDPLAPALARANAAAALACRVAGAQPGMPRAADIDALIAGQQR